jgi:hypothetical protein
MFYLIVPIQDKPMLSTTNNKYEGNESFRGCANKQRALTILQELRMSLRDISIILTKKSTPRTPIIDNGNNPYPQSDAIEEEEA